MGRVERQFGHQPFSEQKIPIPGFQLPRPLNFNCGPSWSLDRAHPQDPHRSARLGGSLKPELASLQRGARRVEAPHTTETTGLTGWRAGPLARDWTAAAGPLAHAAARKDRRRRWCSGDLAICHVGGPPIGRRGPRNGDPFQFVWSLVDKRDQEFQSMHSSYTS